MTQKNAKVKVEKEPTKKIKIGFNMCTALVNTPKQLTDQDIYQALSSKPDTIKF